MREIRRTVPPYLYKDVFVIYNERNLRRQQQSIIKREPLFKGCVFLTCEDTEPLFQRLEKIPSVSRMISSGYLSVFPLMKKDALFLESISGEDHVVHASCLIRETDDSCFYRVYGPLKYQADRIEKIRFSSRYAKTHRMLWGEDTLIPLGIMLNADVRGRILCEGVEVMSKSLESSQYVRLEIDKDATGKNVYKSRSC